MLLPEFVLPALLSGALIGFVLALVGGGGSILAVPLLVYFVGVGEPHMAIGTAAVAVAINAATGLAGHARVGNVRWPCAASFALAGVIGAALGAEAGKRLAKRKRMLETGFAATVIAIGLGIVAEGVAALT